MLAHAQNCLEFFEGESCGKCVPCRLGCQQLVQLTVHLRQGGGGSPEAVRQTVERLGQVMELTSICGLGRAAPNPLLSVLEHFPGELKAPTRKPEDLK
jgi:NADH:ubiquinone oxidoreductase subunit F (NADH-binding)